MNEAKTLSIVVPVFNEEDNIEAFYDVITPILDTTGFESEIVFVDDGSKDGTFGLIASLSERDKRVKCLRFSRNFGSHVALMAGLRSATGDAVIIMAVDLQEPPELIPQLIQRWQEGSYVVWAVRDSRDDSRLQRFLASVFYSIIQRIALPEYPRSGMDMGLFDRVVVDELKRLSELNLYLHGLIVWLGFEQAHIPYHRRARNVGQSKWTVGKKVKNALDAILSFSYVPIRLISYVGFCFAIMSFLYAGYLVAWNLAFGMDQPGWASLMVALMLVAGIQMIFLGILGEYLWRIHEQVKGRSQYVLLDQIGFNRRSSEAKPQGEENIVRAVDGEIG